MNNSLIDILPIALLLVLVFGLRPIKPLSGINENYLSIDTGKYYRGLFAIVVIFHHLSQRTETGFVFRCFTAVGYLAVAVFFFLSGYGLQKSYIDKQESYKKNFLLRRLPPVLFPYIIITVLYWLMNFISGTCYSLKDIIVAIINGSPIVSFSWYIINILIFYVVYWILMLICKKRYFIIIVGGCIWYVLYVLFCMKIGYGNWWYNASQLLVIGMVWATYEEKIVNIIKNKYFILTPLICLLLATLFLFKRTISDLLPIPGISLLLDMITAILFVLCVILFSTKIQIGNMALGFLGNISLEIYLVQGLFITSLRNGIIYIKSEFLWCILVLAGSIFFAYILHLFFTMVLEKYKLLFKA